MPGIDEKWQAKWEKDRIYQPSAGKGEKFYLTAAFPYPNSPQHIGHGRTYTTTDIYARYMRMRGRNVLFPMGFHVTGTPILAMAKRIAGGDREILDVFEKIYGIPPKTAESLTDPRELVAYFSREIEQGMKEMGYSIDWRRKFYSYDAQFNRFVEWHFAKLQQAGFIKKGEHPVPWCPVGNTAIGGHDTKGDVDPQIEEVGGVLFGYENGFLITSTYRPETIYGVTNLWVNPSAVYVKAEHKGKTYYVSKEALPQLSMQMELKVLGEVNASQLLSGKARHPISGDEIPIFPASFVDPKVGTGVVMSVPAHAPLDYLALRDADLLSKVTIAPVLKLDGFGQIPAKHIVEKMGVKSQSDARAHDATNELYKKEAHGGVMVVGEFAGMKGTEAKEKIRAKMAEEGKALMLYQIANSPVYSRFGGLVGVRIVKDQWFIDYGDEGWKAKARECLSSMGIMPEKARHDYEYVIGWLKEKACTRSSGLGTRFPFDREKMIEALSDSTIYMAFYTISHIAMKMKPDELTLQLFDFVFLGKGDGNGLPKEAKKMREEFLYWYPLDSRHSATDLVYNHLTFFIFNHVAIFDKKHWPRQIATNGFVLMDGKKMSKSMGNILPLRAAVRQYGADAIRFTVVSGADISTDTDFNKPAVEGVLSRMRGFEDALSKYAKEKDGKPGMSERWLLSRLHRRALAAPGLYETLSLRDLSLELFYNTFNDMQWYLKRSENPQLRQFFELWVPYIAPFMPHFAEEMWEMLGKKHYVEDSDFAATMRMPDGDKAQVDGKLEASEDYILRVREDISSILRLIRKEKPAKVELFIAADWKRKLRETAAREKKFDTAMKSAMADAQIKPHAAQVAKVLQNYMKNIGALGNTPAAEFEMEALLSGKKLLEDELSCPVSVELEEKSSAPKAAFALPGKPSIMIS